MTFAVVAAAIYLVPALLWGIMARQLADYARLRGGRDLFRVTPIFLLSVALHFLVHAAEMLLPEGAAPLLGRVLRALHEATEGGSLLLAFHVVRLMPVRERRPRMVTVVDVVAVPLIAATVLMRLFPDAPAAGAVGPLVLVTDVSLEVLCLGAALRLSRPGTWRPEAAVEMRRSDVGLIAAGIAVVGLLGAVAAAAGASRLAPVIFIAGSGIAVAVPWTARVLGIVVPEFIVTVALGVAMLAVLGAHRLARAHADVALGPLLDFAALLGLVLIVVPGQRWLRDAVDRAVFRRSRRQLAELQDFLHGLSPEIGIVEACRRTLAELVRVRGLRGAAVILRDGEAVVEGDFDLAPLARVWPRGDATDALPARSFGTAELREMPLELRDALAEARVSLGASPILGRRRRWGHLFMNTGLMGGVFREDDLQEFQAFVAQLALLLDGADLLARTVAVERSLAHAEKLAAVGETAARIAHEIRNPVTAARSLAQQLAREPDAPHAEEHGLILAELERVERQITALLRFARREDLRLEPVALGEMTRGTLASFEGRFTAAGVDVALDLGEEVVAHADREKLRQVLVNLLENALDALADRPDGRKLTLAVSGQNGTATLHVADNGPGVAVADLPRLFEPFFSRKATGTGLGLAIARRTVEAHGGRITAESDPGAGTSFAIALPIGAHA